MDESLIFGFEKDKGNKREIFKFLKLVKKYVNSDIRIAGCGSDEFIAILSEEMTLIVFDKVFWLSSTNEFLTKMDILEKLPAGLIPINLTNKKIVELLFRQHFSDNLLELHIEGDEDFEFFDSLSMYGEGLNYTLEFRRALILPEIGFDYIRLQPKNMDYTLTIWNRNHIGFSKEININEEIDLVRSFNCIYQKYIKEIGEKTSEENINNSPR